MKKIATGMIAAVICLTACKARNEAISKSQMQAKVDSLVGARMEEINAQAMEDLDHRMAIEVKAKADSIVEAYMAAGAKSDSSKTASTGR